MPITIHSDKDVFKKAPDVVIFDLDNTLYNYNLANVSAMSVIEKKVREDLNINSELFADLFSKARNETKDQLGPIASSHSRLLYFQRMLELAGFKAQPLMCLDLEQAYWKTFLSTMVLEPSVIETLTFLRSNGIKIGIITDLTAQIQFRKIIYLGIDKYFDFIVTSEESGSDKIDGKPYDLMLRKLGTTAKKNIWMIGDSEADTTYAKKYIDCKTFQKLNSNSNIHKNTDVSFERFAHLLKNLRKMYSKST